MDGCEGEGVKQHGCEGGYVPFPGLALGTVGWMPCPRCTPDLTASQILVFITGVSDHGKAINEAVAFARENG